MLLFNYVKAYLYCFSGMIASLYFSWIFWVDDKIYTPKTYLIALLVAYIFQRIAIEKYLILVRKYRTIIGASYILFLVLYLSSIVFFKWDYTFLSATTFAQLFLLLTGIGSIYFYVMVIRAKTNISKKIKNPLLKAEKPKSIYEQVKEVDKRLKSNEVYFVLGIDVNAGMDEE